MNLNKTLIGKDNVLFLNNDSSEELLIHCNNLIKVQDITLSRYTFENFIIFIYPNKSLIYKDYLPDGYTIQYRPALEIYKNKFQNNLYDLYEILKYENDIYYKTDTHINNKGNYIVYKFFIDVINSRFNLNIVPKKVELKMQICELKKLPYAIGDLTWDINLGDQTLDNIEDHFYFHDESIFYPIYIIKNNSNIKFLNYALVDETAILDGKNADWNIISNYIIHVKNTDKIPLKIIIFFDSLFLHSIALYFDLFNDIYFIKNVYSNEWISLIQPDYVFEFRVERFLF